MRANETAPTKPTPAAGTRRSAWEQAAVALLVLAMLISIRTERRITRHARTVTVITNVKTEAERVEARRLRDPRDDIAEIYGVPVGSPLDVVPPKSRLRSAWISPVEDPNRRLVPLRHLTRFEKPLAVRMVGHGIALGVTAMALAAYVIGRRRRRRGTVTAPSVTAVTGPSPSNVE